MKTQYKLIGLTKEEVTKILGNNYSLENNDISRIYIITCFWIFKKKIFVDFDESGLADLVLTKEEDFLV